MGIDFCGTTLHTPSVVPQKPTRPSAPAKEQGEYATFTGALRKILSVSHSEMQAKLAAEKQAKQRRGKRASAHASPYKG